MFFGIQPFRSFGNSRCVPGVRLPGSFVGITTIHLFVESYNVSKSKVRFYIMPKRGVFFFFQKAQLVRM